MLFKSYGIAGETYAMTMTTIFRIIIQRERPRTTRHFMNTYIQRFFQYLARKWCVYNKIAIIRNNGTSFPCRHAQGCRGLDIVSEGDYRARFRKISVGYKLTYRAQMMKVLEEFCICKGCNLDRNTLSVLVGGRKSPRVSGKVKHTSGWYRCPKNLRILPIVRDNDPPTKVRDKNDSRHAGSGDERFCSLSEYFFPQMTCPTAF